MEARAAVIEGVVDAVQRDLEELGTQRGRLGALDTAIGRARAVYEEIEKCDGQLPSLADVTALLHAAKTEMAQPQFSLLVDEFARRTAHVECYISSDTRGMHEDIAALTKSSVDGEMAALDEHVRRLHAVMHLAHDRLAIIRSAMSILAQHTDMPAVSILRQQVRSARIKANFYTAEGDEKKADHWTGEVAKLDAECSRVCAFLSSAENFARRHLAHCPELQVVLNTSSEKDEQLLATLRDAKCLFLLQMSQFDSRLQKSDFAKDVVRTKALEAGSDRSRRYICTKDGRRHFLKAFTLASAAAFTREVQLLARLTDLSSTPLLHDVFVSQSSDDVQLVMSMEYISCSLKDYMVRHADQLANPANRMALTRRVIQAVSRLHDKGVGHRDLKPENMMIDLDDELRVVLIDYETAHDEEAMRHTVATTYITKPFATPEQLSCIMHPDRIDTLKTLRMARMIDSYQVGLVIVALNSVTTAAEYDAFIGKLHQQKGMLMGQLHTLDQVDTDAGRDFAVNMIQGDDDVLKDLCNKLLASRVGERKALCEVLDHAYFTASHSDPYPAAKALDAKIHADSRAKAVASLMHAVAPVSLRCNSLIDVCNSLYFSDEDFSRVDIVFSGHITGDEGSVLPRLLDPRTAGKESLGSIPIFNSGTLIPTIDVLDIRGTVEAERFFVGFGKLLVLALVNGIRIDYRYVTLAFCKGIVGQDLVIDDLRNLAPKPYETVLASPHLSDVSYLFPDDTTPTSKHELMGLITTAYNDVLRLIAKGFTSCESIADHIKALSPEGLRSLMFEQQLVDVDRIMMCFKPDPTSTFHTHFRAALGRMNRDTDLMTKMQHHLFFTSRLPPPHSISIVTGEGRAIMSKSCDTSNPHIVVPVTTSPDDMYDLLFDSLRPLPLPRERCFHTFRIVERLEPYNIDKIQTDIRNNKLLQECSTVTLSRGHWPPVPAMRMCPSCGHCGERTAADLDTCKLSKCPCGNVFCHVCLKTGITDLHNDPHITAECTLKERQVAKLPPGIEATVEFVCPVCSKQCYTPESVRQPHCRHCQTQLCLGHVDAIRLHVGQTCEQYNDRLYAALGGKRCPGCRAVVEKISGCDHVVCTWCRTAFNY